MVSRYSLHLVNAVRSVLESKQGRFMVGLVGSLELSRKP